MTDIEVHPPSRRTREELMLETFIEPGYEACFECPFEDCYEELSKSGECPRRQRAKTTERGGVAFDVLDGVPIGWVTVEQASTACGKSLTWCRGMAKTGRISARREWVKVANGLTRRCLLLAGDDVSRLAEALR